MGDLPAGELQSQKTAKDAKSAKQRQDKKISGLSTLFLFFLAFLAHLAVQKIDFAILLDLPDVRFGQLGRGCFGPASIRRRTRRAGV